MGFRHLIVNNRCKLSYSLNYLIVRKLNEEKKVNLDEVELIVVNTLEVSITTALINELSKRKIKIIFCNEKNNPECEIVSYRNNFYSYRKIKEQIAFADYRKDYLWKRIVEEKIINQARNLQYFAKVAPYELLISYVSQVEDNDVSNREGHAAKVYFNALFGSAFSRQSDCEINKYLNYGYAVVLATINRVIKAAGYLTEVGIHHVGESNPFNLSCDFIEPLRPLVDSLVIKEEVNDKNFKEEFVKLFELRVTYGERSYFLSNAIELYVGDLLAYLRTGREEKIDFIRYEL